MWYLSKWTYYADWVMIPIIGLSLLISDNYYHGGLSYMASALFMLGIVIWTFVEYAAHRWLLHHTFRREHWIHHIRPETYYGVPPWQSFILFILVAGGCLGALGIDLGAGLFGGICTGYLIYLWAHDRIHHRRGTFHVGTYWDQRRRDHDVHHARGVEANFGVATHLWDVVFGTYKRA